MTGFYASVKSRCTSGALQHEHQHLGEVSGLGKLALSWLVNETRSLIGSLKRLFAQRLEKPRSSSTLQSLVAWRLVGLRRDCLLIA